jgi:hypothetical protein
MEPPVLLDESQVPEHVLTLLRAHLPVSLPVLRRLQMARYLPGGSTPAAHILLASNGESAHFAAAYVDLSRSPETGCFIYSTLEDTAVKQPGKTWSAPPPECIAQLLLILQRIRSIETEQVLPGARRPPKGSLLVGSLHEATRHALLGAGVGMSTTELVSKDVEWEWYGKWLFRIEDLPGGGDDDDIAAKTGEGQGQQKKPLVTLEKGMNWDVIRDTNDTAIVRSRTAIPRKE